MLDLNHGSGARYEPAPRDFGVAIAVNAAIDDALTRRQAEQLPRRYVSASGLGRECLRQIQYDYLVTPKDAGGDFAPGILRIFEAGHRCEDVVAGWLRLAGFDLRTHQADGSQFGFTALDGRFQGHIDGCLVAGPAAMDYPALWENKALGATSWNDVVKHGVVTARPVYAAQLALYQAYMNLPAPALFTALNRDTWQLHAELVPFNAALAQEMSDRAVQIVRASEAGELLPRGAAYRSAAICQGGFAAGHVTTACPWLSRCWRGSQP